MKWSIDFALDTDRIARLTEVRARLPRFDDARAPDARHVLAGAWFTGAPGREREAAEAWASEMKVYFARGVGEQPVVTYADGTYTVVGLITTSHPGDHPDQSGIVWFT